MAIRFGTVMVKRSVTAAKAMAPGKIVKIRRSLIIDRLFGLPLLCGKSSEKP